eukprot:TRINITY_DN13364_c0_g1_i1.p2 TRINITY_DN13364_c0_g1~~TRINITY_DN13364_c0_g1_i1.p2  ORF type:complete len:240 (-),score=23.74 TRINITY_DN13364_c0_g1_i1:620-1339(-)
MDQTVKELGFQTIVLKDCTLKDFKSEFHKFAAEIEDNDIVIFYFSGHGGQQSNNNKQDNYLFAVDSKYEYDPKTNKQILPGVKVNADILSNFHLTGGIFLIILDTCRVYPSDKEKYKCVNQNIAQFENLPQEVKNFTMGQFQLPQFIGNRQYDIVYACEPGKFAIESAEHKYGYLTTALCESLLKQAYWNDALIDAKKGVYELSQGIQIPQNVSNLRIKLNLRMVTKHDELFIVGAAGP